MNSRVMIPVIWFRLIIVTAFTIFVATQKMWIVAGIAGLSSMFQIGVAYAIGILLAIVVSTCSEAAFSVRSRSLKVCGPTSGGHFNPAVTLAHVLTKGFPPLKALR